MLDTDKTEASDKLVRASNYDAVDAAKARLARVLQAAKDNPTDSTLAAECMDVLFETINTIDDAGYETIPTSIGMSWLHDNPEEFGRLIVQRTNGSDDPFRVVWFFRRLLHHVGNHHVFSVLFNEDLLRLIPEEYREELIVEIFSQYPPESPDWVGVLLKVGISREAIAAMIMHKLRHAGEVSRSIVNFVVHGFLKYGAGRMDRGWDRYRPNGRSCYWFLDKDTVWSVLDDDQLEEALLIVEQKVPGILFEDPHYGSPIITMECRFMASLADDEFAAGSQRIVRILTIAARNLSRNALSNASLEVLNLLPEDVLRELIVKHEGGTIKFLVHMAFRLQDGRKLFDRYITTAYVMNQGSIASTFCWAYPILQKKEKDGKDDALAYAIEDQLKRCLDWAGYKLGTVSIGTVPHGWRKGNAQPEVHAGGKLYIEPYNPYSRRDYRPQKGDLVVFNTKGRHLTPIVIETSFMLVNRPRHQH